MDFFSGVFNSQPVIWLISCKTSSAVARNSGLLAAAGGADSVGAGLACWAATGEGRTKASVIHQQATTTSRAAGKRKTIENQDSRFAGSVGNRIMPVKGSPAALPTPGEAEVAGKVVACSFTFTRLQTSLVAAPLSHAGHSR